MSDLALLTRRTLLAATAPTAALAPDKSRPYAWSQGPHLGQHGLMSLGFGAWGLRRDQSSSPLGATTS